jgi:protein-S-isoprenylcysteine O-methyltransferase Ste14
LNPCGDEISSLKFIRQGVGMTLREMIDLPPVWLLVCLGLTAALDAVLPLPFFGTFGTVAGAALGIGGATIMLAAAAQMVLARTTVIPRRAPSRLVTGGLFRLSRNPIYLADTMILLGAVLWWDVPLALPLVPAFMAIITRRFIHGEEAALRQAFGDQFDAWTTRTGRWIAPLGRNRRVSGK